MYFLVFRSPKLTEYQEFKSEHFLVLVKQRKNSTQLMALKLLYHVSPLK